MCSREEDVADARALAIRARLHTVFTAPAATARDRATVVGEYAERMAHLARLYPSARVTQIRARMASASAARWAGEAALASEATTMYTREEDVADARALAIRARLHAVFTAPAATARDRATVVGEYAERMAHLAKLHPSARVTQIRARMASASAARWAGEAAIE